MAYDDPTTPPEEEWRRVPGDRYDASSLGRIRNAKTGNQITLSPCKGYLRAGQWWVHILVCNAFHGAPPTPEHSARHRDGVRDDNRPENIYWTTARAHADAKPLVTRKVIRRVHALSAGGSSPQEISEIVKLSPDLVQRVLTYAIRGS